MADQLCTTAQVKARIFPTGVTDAADDTLISELIDQVSGFIQTYTRRKLVPDNAATYVFDTERGYVLRIPRGIRSVTSMGVAPSTHQPDSAGTYTTIPAADILLRPKVQDSSEGWPYTEIHISRNPTGTVSIFGRVDNGCTITGNFGFAATPVEITSVAIDAVVAAYAVRKMGASGVVGADDTAVVPWSQFFGRGSPQRAVLDMYRYPAMA